MGNIITVFAPKASNNQITLIQYKYKLYKTTIPVKPIKNAYLHIEGYRHEPSFRRQKMDRWWRRKKTAPDYKQTEVDFRLYLHKPTENLHEIPTT